jgi:hypothetical protein
VTEPVRVRHIVLVVDDIDSTSRELGSVLDIEEVFREPPGLDLEMVNAVLALPNGFLEVCAGTNADAPPSRYLAKAGSPGGYMVLLQFPDFEVARKRAEDAGARVVFEYDTEDHRECHLHPADTGAAIVGIEWSRRWEDWRWAGTEWQGRDHRGAVSSLAGIRISAADPAAIARRWQQLFGIGFGVEADRYVADLAEPGIVIEPWDRPSSRVTGIDLRVTDAAAILGRARALGLPVGQSSVQMLGVDFSLIEE